MEFRGNTRVIEIGALQVPWNSIALLVSVKLAHLMFHGIPCSCSCQRNWRSPSSMELHGTARVCEIGTLQVPWNSMEFHGTARVIEIAAFIVPRNSKEFNGTAHVNAIEVPWNSLELLVSVKLPHFKFHGIPWNSMELPVPSKLAHSKFHGIPWNYSCHRNWRSPWNSIALLVSVNLKFHGIRWNSMQLLVSTKLAHSKFHGIPWNCSCHRNWRNPSSTEFQGTARVSEIGVLKIPGNCCFSAKLAHPNFHGIPCNSMELLVSSKLVHSKLAHFKFHGIP